MQEKIGEVTLNLDYYSGSDLYCDGDIEDVILDIVKTTPKEQYNKVIEEKKSWPVLYHLSHIRGNIADVLPISNTDSVLEIGAGCGAVTEKLSQMCGELTCIDLSKKRSLINAYRNKEKNNIQIMVGNFQEIEKHLTKQYDVITLIGVFEYGACYIESEGDPYEEFMGIVASHLAPGGKLAIAIENKYGIKYFAGSKEDHLGQYFVGIEGYDNVENVRTFSLPALEKYGKNAGFSKISVMYPYPDYKFPMVMYTDDRLPGKGELSRYGLYNFDNDRLDIFNETEALENSVEDGMFRYLSNSYLLVMER